MEIQIESFSKNDFLGVLTGMSLGKVLRNVSSFCVKDLRDGLTLEYEVSKMAHGFLQLQ